MLKTQKEKLSYALGMNLGTNLHKQTVEVDTAIVLRGLKDGLAAGKTLLSEDEARAALTQLQTEVRNKQQEKMKVTGESNKKESAEFLATNKTKEGVVALPSGLQYKILTEGSGPKPSASDTVVCNYRGTLISGAEFDSSYKRGPGRSGNFLFRRSWVMAIAARARTSDPARLSFSKWSCFPSRARTSKSLFGN